MGRFYKPTRMEYIDFMYKLPADMMLKAMTKIDSDIDASIQEVEDLRKLQTGTTQTPAKNKKSGAATGFGGNSMNVMSQHQDRMDYLMQGYTGQIDELATQLGTDPLSYKGMGGKISDVRTSFEKDITTGEMAGMTAQYQQTKQWAADQKEAGVDPTYINQVLAIESEEWGGGNYEDGKFDTLNLPTIHQADLNDIAKKVGKDIKMSGNKSRMAKIINNDMGMNKEVVSTVYQGIKYGQYGNYTDEEGNQVEFNDLSPEQSKAFANQIISEHSNHAAEIYYEPPKPAKGDGKKDKPSATTIITDKMTILSLVGETYDPKINKPIVEQVETNIIRNKATMVASVKKIVGDDVSEEDIAVMLQNNDFSKIEDPVQAQNMARMNIILNIKNGILQGSLDDARNYGDRMQGGTSSFFGDEAGQEASDRYANEYMMENLTKSIDIDSYWDKSKAGADEKVVNQKEVVKMLDSGSWKTEKFVSNNPDLNNRSYNELSEHKEIDFKTTGEDKGKEAAEAEISETTALANGTAKKVTKNGEEYWTIVDGNGKEIEYTDVKGNVKTFKAEAGGIIIDYTKPTNWEADYKSASPVVTSMGGGQFVRMDVTFDGQQTEVFIPVGNGRKISFDFMNKGADSPIVNDVVTFMGMIKGQEEFDIQLDPNFRIYKTKGGELQVDNGAAGTTITEVGNQAVIDALVLYYTTQLQRYNG